MRNFFIIALILFISNNIFAQNFQYNTSKIADSLKQNADAVVRFSQIDITINNQRSMSIVTKRAVTVLNEKGERAIDAVEHYDKKTTVKSIEATAYDAMGNELKHIKRKDFRDQCVLDGITLFSDSRLIYLDYTPVSYPYTIVFESEVTTSNTAQLPIWGPVSDYYVSVENSILNVYYPNDLGFKTKEINFDNFKIKQKISENGHLQLVANNILGIKPEGYAPINSVFPGLMLGLEAFNLEGVDGSAKTWADFGKWYFENILTGTTELPEETKSKIKTLVGTEKDALAIAKIIYKYVQEKSRYVSIQVGIGGFKPMLAADVDRLGYGDCKALSNYTRALLDVVGVPAYNTILYGDPIKHSIDADFVSIQGNHMILTLPYQDKYIGLECTSQDDPFGYQAGFTDERNVLIIKPEGGEIIKTKVYVDKDNLQESKGQYSIDESGNLTGNITIASQGSQYQRSRIENILPTEKETHYKEYWDNINNLKINKIEFNNDKNKIIFTEKVAITADEYAKKIGENLIFVVNVFNFKHLNYKRIRNRKTPFEIQNGYIDTDEINIELPTGFSLESLPENTVYETKFGKYNAEFIRKNDKNIVYKRSYFEKNGIYKNTEYEEFRAFKDQIARNDNAKIVLKKN